MDIQSRKISLISYLSQIQDEYILEKVEKLLRMERKAKYEASLNPMSLEELERDIDESEDDFKAGRYYSNEEVRRMLDKKNGI